MLSDGLFFVVEFTQVELPGVVDQRGDIQGDVRAAATEADEEPEPGPELPGNTEEPAEVPAAEAPPDEARTDEAPPLEAPPAVVVARPEPAPAAVNGAALSGQWRGTMAGRPLTLSLDPASSKVSGQLETTVGPSKVNESVSGRWWPEGDTIGLELTTESGLYKLTGQLNGKAVEGDVYVRGKVRGSWTVNQ